MALKKKAQIFSLISIVILFLLFTSYELYSMFNEKISIKTRVKTMDSFVASSEEDLERKLYISGFRIIFLAEDSIMKSGNYIENFSLFFQESIMNGSSNNTEILFGATLPEIVESIDENGRKMNIDIKLSDIQISVGQEDPWNVVIMMNYTLNVTDEANLASWNKREYIKSYVPIKGFEDPVFLLKTSGKISRKFNQTIFEGNYVSESDVSNLISHMENGYYSANPIAPSFINRLEGRFEANENGIESLVDLDEVSKQGLSVKEKSVVDYIYFSSQNPISYNVLKMPSWFKIDEQHKNKYQVGGLVS